MALEGFLGINTAALPDTNRGVLTSRENPPVAACSTSGVEAASRTGRERSHNTFMTSVCEDSLDVKIRAAGCGVEVLVRGRNDPSFDRAIIACSAHLRLAWTTATAENHTPDNVKMPAQSKFDFELGRVGILALTKAVMHIVLSLRATPS
jgi:hypothetical protein